MRILALLTDAFGGHGGIAKFNRDLLSALCAAPGIERVIALPRLQAASAGPLPDKLEFDCGGIGGKTRFAVAALKAAIANRHSGIVLCGHINLLPIAVLGRRLLRPSTPNHRPLLMLVIHGIDAWQPTRNRLTNWFAHRVDVVVAVSDFTRERFYSWAQPRQSRSFILPNCVDLARFSPGPRRPELMDRYGLRDRTVLLTMSRLSALERYKGVDQVLEILPRLADQIPNLSYLIVGDGTDRPRLVNKARALGMRVVVHSPSNEGRRSGGPPDIATTAHSANVPLITFTGHVPEIEKVDHHRLADVFVMPGSGEGFGIVYLEAMACGVPVVGSKVDGSQEALRHGELGILVDPNNAQEIRVAIIESLTRPRGTVPTGLDHFSNPNFVCRVERMLDELLPPFCGTANLNTSRSAA